MLFTFLLSVIVPFITDHGNVDPYVQVSTNFYGSTTGIVDTAYVKSIGFNTENPKSMKPKKIGYYLWEMGTEGENWDSATNRLAHAYPSYGKCSGVCSKNFHGRNLDWGYNKEATVIIRSPATESKFASIGVVDCSSNFTDEFMMSEKWIEAYHTLPFTFVDGMNEYGVVIQGNVVPTNYTKSAVWHTKREGCIISFAIIRYALDRCSTAYEAANLIKEKIFIPSEFNYDSHYLVSDRNESYIVEDGVVYGNSDGIPTDVLTNFRIGGVEFFDQNSDEYINWETVEPYGQGVERYEYVRRSNNDNSTLAGIISTMMGLWYTKSYDSTVNPFWLTEYCDQSKPLLTVMNAKEHPEYFDDEVTELIETYSKEHDKSDSEHYRGGKTWQTTHMSIYDKRNLTLTFFNQEDVNSKRIFKLKEDGYDEDLKKLTNFTADFHNGDNLTQRVYEVLTNVILTLGGSVTNTPSL